MVEPAVPRKFLPLPSVGSGWIQLLSGFSDDSNSPFDARNRFLWRFWPDAVPPFPSMGTSVPFRGTWEISRHTSPEPWVRAFAFSGPEAEPNSNETRERTPGGPLGFGLVGGWGSDSHCGVFSESWILCNIIQHFIEPDCERINVNVRTSTLHAKPLTLVCVRTPTASQV